MQRAARGWGGRVRWEWGLGGQNEVGVEGGNSQSWDHLEKTSFKSMKKIINVATRENKTHVEPLRTEGPWSEARGPCWTLVAGGGTWPADGGGSEREVIKKLWSCFHLAAWKHVATC